LFKNGIIKIGNNGKFWIIKSNKWMQINEDVKIMTQSYTKLNKNILSIPLVGEYSTNPLFINDLKESGKNKILIEYIYLDSCKDKSILK